MSRPMQVLAGLAAVVVVITIIRLLLPYGLSDTKDIVPEIYKTLKKEAPDQYLTDILAHNLWSQDRQPLTPSDNRVGPNGEIGSDDKVGFDGKVGSDGNESEELSRLDNLPFKLIGISRGEAGFFAVIEFDEGIERFSPGELLPDGSQLEEVLEYGVRISKAGEDDRFYLFGKN